MKTESRKFNVTLNIYGITAEQIKPEDKVIYVLNKVTDTPVQKIIDALHQLSEPK